MINSLALRHSKLKNLDLSRATIEVNKKILMFGGFIIESRGGIFGTSLIWCYVMLKADVKIIFERLLSGNFVSIHLFVNQFF